MKRQRSASKAPARKYYVSKRARNAVVPRPSLGSFRSGFQRHPAAMVFPSSKIAKLTYNTNVTLSSTSGVASNHTFNVSSLFDPDVTNVGHQPLYFDTLCGADVGSAPYSQYRVLGAKVTATFISQGSSYQTGMFRAALFVRRSDKSSGAVTGWPVLGEIPWATCGLGLSAYSSLPSCTLTRNVSIKQVLGIKDVRDDNDTIANYNASPTKSVYVDCVYQPLDEASTATITIVATIDFLVEFLQRNNVDGS